jgi:hypothetical protein
LSKNAPNCAAKVSRLQRLVSENYRKQVVGVTGFEPVTLRLSSACSNQLSYTPARRKSRVGGAEEIRTPDILLAKQTLYQLSYSPTRINLFSALVSVRFFHLFVQRALLSKIELCD